MGAYFKPWRRKIGVVTLALACVFMAWWVRASMIEDAFQLESDWSYAALHTYQGGMNWYRSSLQVGNPGWTTGNVYPDTPSDPLKGYDDDAEIIKWRRKVVGFDIGEMDYHGTKIEWLRIPFYSIIIPLTAISAWLLLSKSKSANHAPKA